MNATIDQVHDLDGDGDGDDEAVARVTPSLDPAPQNERAGFVVFGVASRRARAPHALSTERE